MRKGWSTIREKRAQRSSFAFVSFSRMVITNRRVARTMMARRSDIAIATAMASCFAFAVFHCVHIGQHDWVQHTSHRSVALSMFPPASLQEGREGVALMHPKPVKVRVTDTNVTISNGYVRAVFDRAAPSLKYLAGGQSPADNIGRVLSE